MSETLIVNHFPLTDNMLYNGDHVSWHLPLDQTPSTAGQYNCNPSHIQHMLMVDDPQLPLVTSPLGSVRFIQVGILRAVLLGIK